MARELDEQDYTLLKKSAVIRLQETYKNYVHKFIRHLTSQGYNDNGDFYIVDGYEKRTEELTKLQNQMGDLIAKINFYRRKIDANTQAKDL